MTISELEAKLDSLPPQSPEHDKLMAEWLARYDIQMPKKMSEGEHSAHKKGRW